MKQKIYSTVVILFFTVCLYFYATIFASNIYFEDNRAVVNTISNGEDATKHLQIPSQKDSYFYDSYLQDPANLELYIRASLLNKIKKPEELKLLYQRLLKTRPSWPYYYSGLAQVDSLSGQLKQSDVAGSIKYGKHERQVVYSLAEVLFYGWNKIDEMDRKVVLDYLIGQQEVVISRTIAISVKFAKIYQYCDYIFEKKHVEYAACKRNYWQPLSD